LYIVVYVKNIIMRPFKNYSILTKIIILSSIIIVAGCHENMSI